jgi:hypothetical protein
MTWEPKRPNKNDYRRLLLSKRLYYHAFQHYEQSGIDIDKMIAIHNYHNAIEVFLKTIWSAYDVGAGLNEKDPNRISFPKLIECIDQYMRKDEGPPLPYKTDLININTNRNQVQHQGIEPSKATVDEVHFWTDKFIKNAYELYFGIKFHEVSIIGLIIDDLLKGLMFRANQLLLEKNYKMSLVYTEIAWNYALDSIKDVNEDWRYSSLAGTAWSMFEKNNPNIAVLFSELNWRLTEQLTEIEGELSLLRLGLNAHTYRNYYEISPNVYDNDNEIRIEWYEEPSENDAIQAIDIVSSIFINLQSIKKIPRVKETFIERAKKLIISYEDFKIEEKKLYDSDDAVSPKNKSSDQ